MPTVMAAVEAPAQKSLSRMSAMMRAATANEMAIPARPMMALANRTNRVRRWTARR